MIKPNFLCVGAQKAGTSSLFNILNQSKDVYFSEKKELHFFEKNDEFSKGEEYYLSNFEKRYNGQKLIGEITPEYLFYSYVPSRILKTLGKIKILIILRNPIIRSYSQFNFHKMYQVEKINADFAIEIEKDPIITEVCSYESWYYPNYYISKSLYYHQVKRYIEVFGKENVYVGIFEEIFKKSETIIDPIIEFLDIDQFEFENVASNVSKVNHSNALFNSLGIVKRKVDSVIPQNLSMSISNFIKDNLSKKPESLNIENIIAYNKRFFNDDIKKLESLLDKDLSLWKTT